MQPLTLHLNAHHLVRDDRHALRVDKAAPQIPLRLALVVRGSERHVFPALALDDWGREKAGLGLYRWLYDHGPRFPRAELFGFDAHGAETQIFLRDLELSFPYPCYVYSHQDDPISTGRHLHTIFLAGDNAQPQKTDPPDHLPFPLRRAAVRWRRSTPQALQDAGWMLVSV